MLTQIYVTKWRHQASMSYQYWYGPLTPEKNIMCITKQADGLAQKRISDGDTTVLHQTINILFQINSACNG